MAAYERRSSASSAELDDLAALRLPLEFDQTPAFLAAGIPWFAALFGRDSIITAIQTMPVYPDLARGALAMLALYQVDGTHNSRDMQPGKICPRAASQRARPSRPGLLHSTAATDHDHAVSC